MNNVGPRNETGVFVRGFDLRQVPLFVDGIPVYVPYDGYADLRRFTTFDVSEIDVAKGFSSALYGPNTLGGAINVVSRRPERSFEGDVLARLHHEARSPSWTPPSTPRPSSSPTTATAILWTRPPGRCGSSCRRKNVMPAGSGRLSVLKWCV